MFWMTRCIIFSSLNVNVWINITLYVIAIPINYFEHKPNIRIDIFHLIFPINCERVFHSA